MPAQLLSRRHLAALLDALFVPNGCDQVARLAELGGVGIALRHSSAAVTDAGNAGVGSDLRRDLVSLFFFALGSDSSVTMRADELQGL